jgi:cytochrome c oxidase subunit 2
MQMKIVVDTPEEYKAWLKDKETIVQAVKKAATEAKASEAGATPSKDTTATPVKDTTVVASAEVKK